jgi:hypothetical protein
VESTADAAARRHIVIPWWVLPVALLAALLVDFALSLMTRKAHYQCPPGRSIALTVKRHHDAAAALVALEAAGIDTEVVEEPAKPLARRMLHHWLGVWHRHEPSGPWHIIVAESALSEAERLLAACHRGDRR